MGEDKNVPVERNRKWKLSLRTLALAQPSKYKVTQKYCKAKTQSQYTVSRAALKAKSSPRLAALAEYNQYSARKKYDSTVDSAPQGIVKRGALKARCSPRVEMLARNILVKMLNTLETFKDRGDYFRATMKKYIDLAKTSMYRELYWPKPQPRSESIPRLKSCLYTNTCPPPKSRSETWADLEKWCNENSYPRPIFEPAFLPSDKRKPLSELQKNLPVLAAPRFITPKYNQFEANQFFTGVPKATLKYVPSARIKQLSQPLPRQLLPKEPSHVSMYKGPMKPRPRTEELAKPKPRKEGSSDEKEQDPFRVKEVALKAYCSNRTKELAKPRKVRG